jgi:TfoX/Sxy family transcriptional regulator of competence genes
VPYDEVLARRIREAIGPEPTLTEKRLFGGLSFFIDGNMAIAASGQGGVLVRVDPADFDRLVATGEAYPMEMRGRAMQGWLRVDEEHVRTKRQLQRWVGVGVSFARTLPPKKR